METPRVYYNTVTIDDNGLGFIVGLLQEIYSPAFAATGRRRELLAYQPQLATQAPALPVYHETLTVLTRADWQQTNSNQRNPAASEFFTTYPKLDRLTYFQTFAPLEPEARIWHVLPNDYWPRRIANAQHQLQRDLNAFRHQRPATLPPAALALHQLGYFPESYRAI